MQWMKKEVFVVRFIIGVKPCGRKYGIGGGSDGGITEKQRSNAWIILKNCTRLVIEGNEYQGDKKELAKKVLELMD